MSNDIGPIIFLSIILLIVVWFPKDEYKATPADITFAESVCKEGKWVTVDSSQVICKDGATYKLKQDTEL